MRKGYTMTYQMRKKQRQQREIIIQYALKFVGVVLLAFDRAIRMFQFYDSGRFNVTIDQKR